MHPSNVQILKLKVYPDRTNLIERKQAGRNDGKNKGKYTNQDVDN